MKYVLGAVFSVLIGLASSVDFTYAAVSISPARVSIPVRVSTPSARVSTPTPSVRSSTPRVSTTSNSTNMLPMYMLLPVIAASSSASHASTEADTVEVATPMLTVCTTEQYVKAQQWQEDCRQVKDIPYHMCPILSYFRQCKEATPDDVKGLLPAKANYRHVYIKPN
ncbi:hypothetical protein FDI21_gp281 [Pseudomonas phage Noxifer]|uniref:Uncharacterized protein n=1 Tax=Pseudomonas phage Noxifer TaxID=2006684 RepID=A0A1Y0SVH6_9CAUD|nr:hypothetical protein FDI21_gp281 [Pseudomonas phage Noxifer]ARV77430.1 hypothetical protein NOXIFER_265 [Pseudomonas phage Noxifer]